MEFNIPPFSKKRKGGTKEKADIAHCLMEDIILPKVTEYKPSS